MYLLDTTTGELKEVADPTKEVYAILSHVWKDGGEPPESFQEILQLNRDLGRGKFSTISNAFKIGRSNSPSILSRVSAKIRRCCEYARKHGIKKVWIDSCCIDKTSSSELSEAINSMYEWYGASAVCIAFLYDVSDSEEPSRRRSSFRRSEWFKRGWTLQELIAPRRLQFVSKEWRLIGTKATLAGVIEEITGIPRDVLIHRISLDTVSVAKRMSWASRRNATRPEDEAYSLMGIFGVRMPTIYGEGRAAFHRLQEEILKHIGDQSVFAWGAIYGVSSPGSSLRGVFESKDGFDPTVLFAHHPADFHQSGDIEPVELHELGSRLGIPAQIPDYSITSYGVRSSFPSIALDDSSESSIRLAVLGCEAGGRLIALLLTREHHNSRAGSLGRYVVGVRGSAIPPWLLATHEETSAESSTLGAQTARTRSSATDSSGSQGGSQNSGSYGPTLTDDMFYRAIVLPRSPTPLLFRPISVRRSSRSRPSGQQAEWASIYVIHRVQTRRGADDLGPRRLYAATRGLPPSDDGAGSVAEEIRFQCPCEMIIPGWAVASLGQKGYTLQHLTDHRQTTFALPVGFSPSPEVYPFAVNGLSESVLVYVGPCPSFDGLNRDSTGHTGPMPLCVQVAFVPGPGAGDGSWLHDDPVDDVHSESCWMEHVDSWDRGSRAFRRGRTTVRIKFSNCIGAWSEGSGRSTFMMKIDIRSTTKAADAQVDHSTGGADLATRPEPTRRGTLQRKAGRVK